MGRDQPAILPARCRGVQRDRGVQRVRSGGFTLIELLVSISIIVVILSILLPAVQSLRGQVRELVCASHQKSILMDFQLFAENQGQTTRGASDTLGSGQFWIDDFQEMMYGIDEFWDEPGENTVQIGAEHSKMICPASRGTLVKRRGLSCGNESIGPPGNVSVAVNMRLRQATTEFGGRRVLAPIAATHVSAQILRHPSVPVLIDVDGEQASAHHVEPFYIAPGLEGRDDPYADGQYWFPSTRHNGRTNVAFVGGHVLSSTQAQWEPWDWGYEASIGR